ncbi:Acetyl-coenzyme A synthetase [subsurface metagenome]
MGRADEILKVAGHRIGTAELEDAAVSHPQVAEAAVVSKAHPVKGESIVIFVRLNEGVSPSPTLKKELTNHMRSVIGPIATPDEVYFTTKLPKTRSGKIMRRVLKAVASGASIGDLTTLEDEASVAEIIRSYQELKKAEEAK